MRVEGSEVLSMCCYLCVVGVIIQLEYVVGHTRFVTGFSLGSVTSISDSIGLVDRELFVFCFVLLGTQCFVCII